LARNLSRGLGVTQLFAVARPRTYAPTPTLVPLREKGDAKRRMGVGSVEPRFVAWRTNGGPVPHCVAKRGERRSSVARPTSKLFCQTFPNIGLFRPRISKDSFWQFYGISRGYSRCKPKKRPFQIFVFSPAPRVRRASPTPSGSMKRHESTVACFSVSRKRNPPQRIYPRR
jgi:hypothetical protein